MIDHARRSRPADRHGRANSAEAPRGRGAALGALIFGAALTADGRAEAAGCVAGYGPTTGCRPAACSYVASGPVLYVAFVGAGGFDIYVDGKPAVSGWEKPESAGLVPASAGQTVTVVTQCERGVFCAAEGGLGMVEASDAP